MTSDSARIAIITARGGSKRIPRKNLRAFHGRPIITWTIETARKSRLFSEVMVSTEDPEIERVAREAGACVPFRRSAATADDHATTAAVLREVLLAYRERGQAFSVGCCLYPTAALVTEEMLVAGLARLDGEHDVVMPVVAHRTPAHRALVIDTGNGLRRLMPEHALTRTQDLPLTCHDAGQFYWFRVAPFLDTGVLIGDRTAGLLVDAGAVQDIDDEADWREAERKFASDARAAGTAIESGSGAVSGERATR